MPGLTFSQALKLTRTREQATVEVGCKERGARVSDTEGRDRVDASLRLLILEDRPADAELMVHELRRHGLEPDWRLASSEAEFLAQLVPALDLILADYALSDFDALRALRLLQERGLDIPFIIVSGSIGEDVAVSAIKEAVGRRQAQQS